MKKQKPAKQRGNPAKQRQKGAGSLRVKHVDPLTSLARTAGPNAAPQVTRRKMAEPASFVRTTARIPGPSRTQGKATARALAHGYAWEDREAFAIVCAPFLILALWFTYQQTMRPIPSPLPEIAAHRDVVATPPAIAMAPQPQLPLPAPMSKSVEPALSAATPPPLADASPAAQANVPATAPRVREPALASPAPALTEPAPTAPPTPDAKPAPSAPSLPTAPELSAIQPPPLATIAPPAPPVLAPRVAVKRVPAPAQVAPSSLDANQSPRSAAPPGSLPPLAALAPERPAPAPPVEVVPIAPAAGSASIEREGTQAHPDIAAPASPLTQPAQERQRHAALAPMAPVEVAPPPAIVPSAPAIAPPVELLTPVVPAPPQATPAAIPQPAERTQFDVCEAHTKLFVPARASTPIAPLPGPDFGLALARAARDQLTGLVIYNAKYARIGFPNGDVASLFGVCTDVVVRAYRMLGIDLQQLIAETKSGRGDRNIDHRRVEVLRTFLARHGETLPITDFAEDYQPGDIVTYYRPQNRTSTTHIAVVSDSVAPSGRYMIVHNRGWGPQLEDALFVDKITGHFRFSGPKKPLQPDRTPAPPSAIVIASSTPWASSALARRGASASPAEAPLPLFVTHPTKSVIASQGNGGGDFCRPGGIVSGSAHVALALASASPTLAKPALTPAAKAQPTTKPAQAKAQPKPLQKAATGTNPRPASL